MKKNIVLSGVGGQGILTLGRVLGTALMNKGYDVRVGEVHGLSQRGGSVIVFVRYGEKIYAPTVSPGFGDLLVSLELLEALRRLEYLSAGGTLVVNDLVLPPPMSKEVPSRNEIIGFLDKLGIKYHLVDGLALAEKAGSPLALNMVMLGAAIKTGILDVDLKDVEEVIRGLFPPKVAEINVEALVSGYKALK